MNGTGNWVQWYEASADGTPMPVVLSHLNSHPGITPGDSVALWGTLNRIEAELGLDLFRPMTEDSTNWPYLLITVDVNAQKVATATTSLGYNERSWPVAGWRGGSAKQSVESLGEVGDTRVTVNSSAALTDDHLWREVTLYALGFEGVWFLWGKRWCVFHSIQANCSQQQSWTFTLEDAAAIQLYYRALGAFYEEFGQYHPPRVPAGIASLYGQRALWLGLDPVPVWSW